MLPFHAPKGGIHRKCHTLALLNGIDRCNWLENNLKYMIVTYWDRLGSDKISQRM